MVGSSWKFRDCDLSGMSCGVSSPSLFNSQGKKQQQSLTASQNCYLEFLAE